ncbi:MAG: hypothetical protein HYV29_08475 [Ignavibacteriales bacterium]|nr:hypothetical protein [Ignavibacteriales bacterium]
MNRDELYRLLIDYAEGTLDSSQKKLIETELKKSYPLRKDLELLQSTFASLQRDEEEDISSYYFSNFLPRLRENIDRRKTYHLFVVPLWLQKLAAPLSVAVVILSLFGLYNLLLPDTTMQVLRSIVHEAEQGEVEQLIATGTPFGVSTGSTSSVFSSGNEQMLAEELLTTSSLYDNVVSDSQILSQLDEQDVDLIVQHLNTGLVR